MAGRGMTTQSVKWWGVSEWEFREAVRDAREASNLRHGQRKPAMRAIASRYGISERTLYRWLTYDVQSVRCGKFEALFVVSTKRPSQVTPWEKAA